MWGWSISRPLGTYSDQIRRPSPTIALTARASTTPVPSCGHSGTSGSSSRTSLSPTREITRSEEHTSELQSRGHLVCRLLLEKKKQKQLPRLRQAHARHHQHAE